MQGTATASLTLLALTLATATAAGCSSNTVIQGAHAQDGDAGSGGPGDDEGDAGVDDAPGVDNGAPSEIYPAPHAEYARMVTAGGPVMKTPKLRSVTFPGDPHAPTINGFFGALGASEFWRQTTAEYGVGLATAGDPIVRTDAAPAQTTVAEIADLVKSQLDGATPAWGAYDPSALYVLFYPPTTSIKMQGLGTSCAGFHGYHNEVTVGGHAVPFSVIAECPTDNDGWLTGVTSHEMTEAATDPFPQTAPAWSLLDTPHVGWTEVAGAEVADMCFFGIPTSLGSYTVFAAWSNASLAAGGPPCVPDVGKEPYFNAAPVLTDKVYVATGRSGLVENLGVKVAVGKTKTIELDLFSKAKTSGPWTVSAMDERASASGTPSKFRFALDRDRGVNGEKLHLSVTPTEALPGGGAFIVVVSTLKTQRYFWYVYVEN